MCMLAIAPRVKVDIFSRKNYYHFFFTKALYKSLFEYNFDRNVEILFFREKPFRRQREQWVPACAGVAKALFD